MSIFPKPPAETKESSFIRGLRSTVLNPVKFTWTAIPWTSITNPTNGILSGSAGSDTITVNQAGFIMLNVVLLWNQATAGYRSLRAWQVAPASGVIQGIGKSAGAGAQYLDYTLNFTAPAGLQFRLECYQDSDAPGQILATDVNYGQNRLGVFWVIS